ncbi:MAG: hypothetical protein Q7R47_00335, partial [Candidatus Diapherotrites archaeon]|nr:hypothetical protein [Candidatus Diapherotrites archaeon]
DVLLMALADRGGQIERLTIEYPIGAAFPKGPLHSPAFGTRTMTVSRELIDSITGLKLSDIQIIELLSSCGFDAKKTANGFFVTYPDYRQDVLHPVDLVEDLLIAYGYNRIPTQPVKMAVIGNQQPQTKTQDFVRDACIGMGLQEVLTYYLTSIDKQTQMAGIEKDAFVRIANPVSTGYEIYRKRIYPQLLEFLSKNKHVTYPQKIFEVGKVLELDPEKDTGVSEPIHLCIAIADPKTDFTTIKSHCVALAQYLGQPVTFERTNHPSFEQGKAAEFRIGGKKGVVGELSKQVRQNFGLTVPITVLEVEL